jgi:putative heme-binding domain-containing protein
MYGATIMFLTRNLTLLFLIAVWGHQTSLQASIPLSETSADLAGTLTFAGEREPNPDLIEQGRALFASSPMLSCRDCHSLNPGEVYCGPSLSGIGDRLSLEEIAMSILEPSARIAPGFERQIVATSKGQMLEGRIEFQDHSSIGIRLASELRVIPTSDVEEILLLGSEMPTNCVDGLGDEEFTALVWFLASLRSDSHQVRRE